MKLLSRLPGNRTGEQHTWPIQSRFRNCAEARSSFSAKSAQEYCIFGSSIASKKSLLRSYCTGRLFGAPGSLLVHEKRSKKCPDIGKFKFETFLKAGTNRSATHLIQRIAVPPAVHVGFPKPSVPEARTRLKKRRSCTCMSQGRSPLMRMSADASRLAITSCALHISFGSSRKRFVSV